MQDYAAHDPAGRDLQPLVDLVGTQGTDAILAAVAQVAPESQAEVIVSTTHRAKGREWARVRIADHFTRPQTATSKTTRAVLCLAPSTTAQPASPTWLSRLPARVSAWAACPGSTITLRDPIR